MNAPQAIPSAAADPLASLDFSEIETAQIITCTIEGFVEFSDLDTLLGLSGAADKPAAAKALTLDEGMDINRIREKHHSVARLVAQNFENGVICAIVGYTPAYLSTLLNNPAMQELIRYYRAQQSNASEVIAEKLRSVAMRAVEQLAERIDEDGDNAPSNNDLIQLAKLGLDRSGHGPTSTQVINSTQHIVDYAELQRLNRAAKGDEDDFIDMPTALPAPEDSSDAAA